MVFIPVTIGGHVCLRYAIRKLHLMVELTPSQLIRRAGTLALTLLLVDFQIFQVAIVRGNSILRQFYVEDFKAPYFHYGLEQVIQGIRFERVDVTITVTNRNGINIIFL